MSELPLLDLGVLPRKHARGAHCSIVRAPAFIQTVFRPWLLSHGVLPRKHARGAHSLVPHMDSSV